MEFDSAKLAKLLSETFSNVVKANGDNDAEDKMIANNDTAFTIDGEDDDGVKNDWFVKTAVPKERDSYNGFKVTGDDIPDVIKTALGEVGGANSDLSNVWVQPGANNKVTYGITDGEGNTVWVRYELDENGNARETKRTVRDKDGNFESTGVESDNDVPNVALNALRDSVGSNINPSAVNIQKMDDGNSFVYSAKDEDGKTTYIKYTRDDDGSFTEVKRTLELGNGKFKTIDGKEALTYTIDENGEQNVESTAKLDEDGDVVSIKFAGGNEIGSDVVLKLKGILGSDYDFTTLTMTNEGDNGDITYNVKDKDGNDAWVRLDKFGNETARTIETQENQFYSIYNENDVNQGEDGATRIVMRTFDENGEKIIDEAKADADKISYDNIAGLQTILAQLSSVMSGEYDAEDIPQDIIETAEVIKGMYADGATAEDVKSTVVSFIANALNLDPEEVANTKTLSEEIDKGINNKTDWFVTAAEPEEKDAWGGFSVDGDLVSDEIKEQIKKDFDGKANLDSIWVQKSDNNLVTYGFKDENGNNVWIRYEIGEDGTPKAVKQTIAAKEDE